MSDGGRAVSRIGNRLTRYYVASKHQRNSIAPRLGGDGAPETDAARSTGF